MNIYDLHEETWKRLGEWRDRLPHALLLTGQRGIGKFDLARALAGSLLCENPLPSRVACGSCLACAWMAQGNHPDFRLVQPEALAGDEGEGGGNDAGSSGKKKPSQQIIIDQIRALDDFLHVGTHRQGMRVVLLHPAEAMNRSTANSLLKSLEEPVPGTLFLLVSNEPERLIPTIRSRCQQLSIPLPESSRAQAWMAAAGVKEAAHWLALAGGSPLLAVELGSGDEHVLLDALVAELAKGGRLDPLVAAAAVDRVVKAEKRPASLKRLVEWGQKWFVDLILLRTGQAPRYFLAQSAPLRELARRAELPDLLAFNRKALQYRQQCEQPLNSRLFLEDYFLNYALLFEPVREAHG
ncbi:DNA polymerase III subunit delta' [Betaproteobacteria bacterium]|nr:DNA polymerase III subunit delta' [Betaproteobacteria bacterium]